MTPDLMKAVPAEMSQKDWQPIYRELDGKRIETGQEWAEVYYFILNAISHYMDVPLCCCLAIREPLGSMDLPGMPQQEFPFQTLQMDLAALRAVWFGDRR